MREYRTAEVAKIAGIHPNTVRFYEESGLITKPERRQNGYRVFTDLHIRQIKLARIAFRVEVLQNGLRKKAVAIVKIAAKRDFDRALSLADEYVAQTRSERANAEEAIKITLRILDGESPERDISYKRSEAALLIGVSVDSVRNWEMNGLLCVKRKENGYRVYSGDDMRRMKIIRSLRCANYSLEAILRMLTSLTDDPRADISRALNSPARGESVISACDRLLVSLAEAEKNALVLIDMLREMKNLF